MSGRLLLGRRPGRARSAVAALGATALLAAGFSSQDPGWDDDFFAELIVGEWAGRGTVRGRSARASRHWRFDLAGHYLRADLRLKVEGSEGRRALGYWSLRDDNAYRILWIDETGVERDFIARGEPADDEVIGLYFVNEPGSLGRPPVMRRMSFRIEGPDRYIERIEERSNGGWKPIAELVFTRVAR